MDQERDTTAPEDFRKLTELHDMASHACDLLKAMANGKLLGRLNQCCIFFQTIFLSDVTTRDRLQITKKVRHGGKKAGCSTYF